MSDSPLLTGTPRRVPVALTLTLVVAVLATGALYTADRGGKLSGSVINAASDCYTAYCLEDPASGQITYNAGGIYAVGQPFNGTSLIVKGGPYSYTTFNDPANPRDCSRPADTVDPVCANFTSTYDINLSNNCYSIYCLEHPVSGDRGTATRSLPMQFLEIGDTYGAGYVVTGGPYSTTTWAAMNGSNNNYAVCANPPAANPMNPACLSAGAGTGGSAAAASSSSTSPPLMWVDTSCNDGLQCNVRFTNNSCQPAACPGSGGFTGTPTSQTCSDSGCAGSCVVCPGAPTNCAACNQVCGGAWVQGTATAECAECIASCGPGSSCTVQYAAAPPSSSSVSSSSSPPPVSSPASSPASSVPAIVAPVLVNCCHLDTGVFQEDVPETQCEGEDVSVYFDLSTTAADCPVNFCALDSSQTP